MYLKGTAVRNDPGILGFNTQINVVRMIMKSNVNINNIYWKR